MISLKKYIIIGIKIFDSEQNYDIFIKIVNKIYKFFILERLGKFL